MKKFHFVIACTCIISIAIAQPVPDLVKRYNGPASKFDAIRAMVVDAAGNIYVTGPSEVKKGNMDFATIKYNSAGGIEWTKTYNGTANGEDWSTAIAIDAGGNVYVTGRSTGVNTNLDYATIKYKASDGQPLWVRRYNSTSNRNDYPKDVAVDASGNVYVTGWTNGSGPFNGSSITTIMYNNAGDALWTNVYDGYPNVFDGSATNREEGNSIVVDNNGNCYVTGESGGSILIKYDLAGNRLWAKPNAGRNGRKVALAADGNVLVATWGGRLAKHDKVSGDIIWQVTAPGGDNAALQNMTQDASGNIYVAGYVQGLSGSGADYLTVKYNAVGLMEWAKQLNGSGNGLDIARSIAIDNSGDVYVTGQLDIDDGSRNGTSNIGTVKYNSAGGQEWLAFYDAPEKQGSDGFVVCTALNNVYVAGQVSGKASYVDFVTLRYPQSASRNIISAIAPEDQKIIPLTNYPNPFNSISQVQFYLSQPETVEIGVYTLNGKLLKTLIKERRGPGKHTIPMKAADFASGTYVIRMQYGQTTLSKKMTVIR